MSRKDCLRQCRGGQWPSGGELLRNRIGYGEYVRFLGADEQCSPLQSKYKKASTKVEAFY